MVTAISGAGAPYTAPTSAPSTDTTASAPGAAPATAAPQVNIAEDPSTWTWEHRQQVATNWVERNLLVLHDTAQIAKWGSDKNTEREAQDLRSQGASEERIAAMVAAHKEHGQRAQESLVNAKANLEKQGFKVTGTVYEKGADGEWRMGQFTLDARRDGYILHYDSSSGLTVTPDAGTAGGGAAAVTDPAKAAAMVKAADAADIYAQAKAQADQYNKLFDKLETAFSAWSQADFRDPQSKADMETAQAEIDAFRFEPWNDRLRQAGFNLGAPLVSLNVPGNGRAVIGARTLNSVVDGLNLNVKFDGQGGVQYRHEGSDGWQFLDEQAVADVRTLVQQALTRPVNLVA